MLQSFGSTDMGKAVLLYPVLPVPSSQVFIFLPVLSDCDKGDSGLSRACLSLGRQFTGQCQRMIPWCPQVGWSSAAA